MQGGRCVHAQEETEARPRNASVRLGAVWEPSRGCWVQQQGGLATLATAGEGRGEGWGEEPSSSWSPYPPGEGDGRLQAGPAWHSCV